MVKHLGNDAVAVAAVEVGQDFDLLRRGRCQDKGVLEESSDGGE
jgi:hypothetical protein